MPEPLLKTYNLLIGAGYPMLQFKEPVPGGGFQPLPAWIELQQAAAEGIHPLVESVIDSYDTLTNPECATGLVNPPEADA